MLKLIGKEIKNGEYKGNKYSHLYLYCTNTEGNDTLEGSRCEVVKAKKDVARLYNDINLGDEFRVYYDRFGNVEEISIQA